MSETLKEHEKMILQEARFAKWQLAHRKSEVEIPKVPILNHLRKDKRNPVVKKELPIHLRIGF